MLPKNRAKGVFGFNTSDWTSMLTYKLYILARFSYNFKRIKILCDFCFCVSVRIFDNFMPTITTDLFHSSTPINFPALASAMQ